MSGFRVGCRRDWLVTACVFAVVGPGAVGGLLAWLLQRAGHEVVAVGRPATVDAIRRDGIEVRSELFGNGVERVRAETEDPGGRERDPGDQGVRPG